MTSDSGDRTISPDGLTVGAVASTVGITVRTLHHWDTIDLIRPSERTPGGYRLYSASDIARVHRVLFYRELGLPLESIAELLDASAAAAQPQLQHQRMQLTQRISHMQGMVEAVDRLIEATNTGILLSDDEQAEIFGRHWQPSRVGQARERWADTVQWAEYAEHCATMTAEDWRRMAENTSALSNDLATAKRAGVTAGSTEGNSLAERHRTEFVGTHFHCTHEMHVCMGRMYAAEAGFSDYYDALEPGLTQWLGAVIDANARDHGVDPETATWG
ncbi:MerR family transcriptional regulator [Rhodococcus sp. SRB_17]|nr:MerR family transcriptional regulator [Rhodococcus sp. SRB_17]